MVDVLLEKYFEMDKMVPPRVLSSKGSLQGHITKMLKEL